MMQTNIQQPLAASSSAGQRSATVSREAELSAQFSKAAISDLPPLENRANQSASPYVRAHASTPVAWQLLDDEALQRAHKESKLIFMNIGFKSCHYCRLTTQESFSHPEVAKLLNTSFVPIIVDREDRPDIDNIYMNFVQASNGAGGWPLNVFVTPDLEPVFGGTYWPSPGTELIGRDGEEVAEDERIDFLLILQKMKKLWSQHESRCRQEAKESVSQLRVFAAEGTSATATHGSSTPSNVGTSNVAAPTDDSGTPMAVDSELDLDHLEEAYAHITETFDPVNGGFGIAPKFPTPAKLSFLFRLGLLPPVVADVVGEKEVAHAKHMVYHTLRRLQQSALRDHLGGGFHRYAVTANWSVPHFEKMVSDNALLLGVYLDAWLSNAKLSTDAEFANMVFELADYLTSPPILRDDGGFATSEAADSFYKRGDNQMREGAYYLWTRREFQDVLRDTPTIRAFATAYWNVQAHGNVGREQDPNDEFMNQNVLHAVRDAEALRQQLGVSASDAQEWIETARATLRAHREKDRVRPATDDKAVTSVNALVISSLARTSAAIKQVAPEKSRQYLDAATKAATFVKEKLWDPQTSVLYRSYCNKRRSTQGFADDYAFLIEALIDLYETAGEERWLEWADELQRRQIDLFYDPIFPNTSHPVTPMAHDSACGGFYSTADDAPHVILRLKDGMDTAQPSTNAVSTSNLFRLGFMMGDKMYNKLARETINAFEAAALQYPWLFIGLLQNVVTARLGGIVWLTKHREFYELPRAGLRSLVFLKEGKELEESWLVKRNPALSKLEKGTYQFDETYKPYKEEWIGSTK